MSVAVFWSTEAVFVHVDLEIPLSIAEGMCKNRVAERLIAEWLEHSQDWKNFKEGVFGNS